MKMLPEVKITYRKHRGEDKVFFAFKYEVEMVNLVKQLSAKYSSTYHEWHIPDSPEARKLIFSHLSKKAYLRWPQDVKKKKEIQAKRQAITKLPLTDNQKRSIEHMERLLNAAGRGEKTVETYTDLAGRMLRFLAKNPYEITSDDILRFQSDFMVKNNYALSTQRQFATSIKWFLDANHLPNVRLDDIPRPKKEKRLPKVLSRTEVMAILSASRNLKHRTMLSLMYSSGLRVGEVIDLRLADFNFEQNTIHVRSAKGRRDRLVTYGKSMAIMLKNYIEEFLPREFLFNGKGNPRYSATSIRKNIKQAAERAGIFKEVSPHMLRHSYATHMIEDGVNLRYVQELLGHSRPETTQIYTHVASEHLMKLKNPFDSLLNDFNGEKMIQDKLTNRPSLSRKSKDTDNF